MSWFSQQWNKFASGLMDDEQSGQMIRKVEVIWGRERITIPIDEQAPNQATLKHLKNLIVQHTSVPYEQIKLVVGGLVMKDDKAPLSAYGIQTGTRVQLIGTAGGVPIQGDRPGAKASVFDTEGGGGVNGIGKLSKGEEMARKKKEREEDLSEKGLLNRVEEIVSQVRKEILPEILEFEQTPKDSLTNVRRSTTAHQQQQQQNDFNSSSSSHNGTSIPPSSNTSSSIPSKTISPADSAARKEQLAKQHRKLSELLLRALLNLDGVNVNSEETRKRRKEAVKEIQGYLDRVDATWSQLKEQKEFSSSSSIRSANGPTASLT